jgi:hypothetical protein
MIVEQHLCQLNSSNMYACITVRRDIGQALQKHWSSITEAYTMRMAGPHIIVSRMRVALLLISLFAFLRSLWQLVETQTARLKGRSHTHAMRRRGWCLSLMQAWLAHQMTPSAAW